jgi:hypothetical protein
MTGIIATETYGQVALGGSVPGATASIAKGGRLTVAGLMVMPTTCLAIQVGFARRGRWRKTLECLGIFVEGFCSLVVFFVALVPSLPLYLYHDPLKGVGLGEFL